VTPAAPLVNPRVYCCPREGCGFPVGAEDDETLVVGAILVNHQFPLVCARCRNCWRWQPAWKRRRGGEKALDTPTRSCKE
jgi:hypothetical protein